MWKKLILVVCCIGIVVILTGFSGSQLDLRDARDTGVDGLCVKEGSAFRDFHGFCKNAGSSHSLVSPIEARKTS